MNSPLRILRAAPALLLAALPALGADDPFALTANITSQAAFSCQDLVVNGSARTTSVSTSGKGHVVSNGSITVSGNSVIDGNATAGPGKNVTVTGNAKVTGTKGPAATAVPCVPVDLAALAPTLKATNDNARIPRTAKGADPLSGSGHTELVINGNDSLALPAGTYYLTKLVVNGNATLSTTGLVRILCVGAVDINGETNTNASASPFNLRIWTSGTAFNLNGNTSFAGFIYAPNAATTLNGNGTLTGGLFAKQVTLNGGIRLVRKLDESSPSLDVTQPHENDPVDLSAVVVKGTASDPDSPVTVTVNGTLVPLAADGSFSITVDLHAMASPAITVVATDAVLHTTTKTVNLCTTKPTVIPDPVGVNGAVGQHLVTLTGSCPNATALTIDGKPAVVAGEKYTFSNFDLGSEGDHTLTLVATGRCGSSPPVTQLVSLDTLPPAIKIDFPADQKAIGDTKTDVGGTVSDPHLDTVTVNGLRAEVVGGRFTAKDVPLAVEGPNGIEARAVDTLSHAGTDRITVYRDSAAPTVKITLPVDGAFFKASPIRVEGIAESVNLVSVKVCEKEAVLSGSTFVVEGCVLAEGSNALTAKALDRIGLTTDSVPVHVTLDTKPPVVAISATTPAPPTTADSVSVTGTVSDDNLKGVWVNGVPATVKDGAFEAKGVPLVEGANALVARAEDLAGWTTDSNPFKVERDTQPPVVEISAPASGACFAADRPIEVSGTYADAHPPAADPVVVTVRDTKGNTTEFRPPLEADGRTFKVAAVTLGSDDGIATITAEAKDALGLSARSLVSVRADAQAPAVTLLLDGAPFPGAAPGAAPVDGEAATLFARAVTPRVLVADGAVAAPPDAELELDGSRYTEGTPIAVEGRHLLVARAADCAGHETAVHALFTVDVTPPVLVSSSPAPGQILGDAVSAFTGTANSDLSAAFVNGVRATLPTPSTFAAAFAWREGANTALVELVDLAGNRASTTVAFTVKTLAPRVEILESGIPIPPDALFLREIAPTFRCDDPQVQPTAKLNGADFASGTPVRATNSYTLVATATDAAGHTTEARATFRVDTDPPPTIAIGTPDDQAVLPTASADVSGTTGASTQRVTVNGRAAQLGAGTWSIASLPLEPDVPNEIVAVASDAAGRTASASRSVTVKTSGPKLVILSPAEGTKTNRAKVDVTGAVLGGAASTKDGTVSVNGRRVPVDATGAFRANDVDLADGETTITATALDAQDRPGTASVKVVADLHAPVIAILADGHPLVDGATLPKGFALKVDVTDNMAPAPIPLVRLNGRDLGASTSSPEFAVPDEGGYVVAVQARDAAGNETRAERSFVVGAGGCGLADLDPPDGATVAGASVTIHGKVGAARAVVVRVPNPGTNPVTYTEYPAQIADGTFAAGDVPLAVGENALQVVCSDATGPQSPKDLRITRLPDAGPAVRITAPAAGSLTAQGSLAVTGTVSDAGAAVWVNGTQATVTPSASGATWSLDRFALVEGPNVLSARAVDRAGRAGEDRLVVQRDATPPRLQITSPPDGAAVGPAGASAAVDVYGVVEIENEPNLRSVDVSTAAGSVSATVDAATGAFRAAGVPLSPGAQSITATAKDALEQTGTSAVTVTFDPAGPAIRLSQPADGLRVTESSPSTVAIAGEAWAAEGARVSVNGGGLDPASLAWSPVASDARLHATFSAQVASPAADGGAAVIARVDQIDGRSATDRRLLIRDTAAPTVLEVVPSDGAKQIDPNAILLVLFSEPVVAASLSSGTGLTLTRVSTGETVVTTTTVAGSAVACVPGAALARGEQYRFRAGTGITDFAGHPLAQAREVSFTVALSPTDAPPILDPLPALLCATKIDVKGSAVPGATVRVRDEEMVFTGTADASGRFTVSVPISASGFHHLHVAVLGRDGVSTSPEVSLLVRVDCSAPTVTASSLDRATGLLTIAFSEAMRASSLTVGDASAAIGVSDAEDAARTPHSAPLALSSDGTVATIDLGSAADAWWRSVSVRLEVGSPAADVEGNAMASRYETIFFHGTGSGDLSGAFLSGQVLDDATGRPLADADVKLFAGGAVLPGSSTTSSTPFGSTTTDGRGRYQFAGDVPAGRYALVVSKGDSVRAVRRLPLEPAMGAVPFGARITSLAAPSSSKLGIGAATIEGAPGSGLTLDVAANALPSYAGDVNVQLTPLSGQGLPELLPLGYTPLAAAHVRLSTTAATPVELPEGDATPFAAGAAKLTLPLPAGMAVDATLLGARYDIASGLWLTIPAQRNPGTSGAPDTATVTLVGPGAVAVVVADTANAIKPPALGDGIGVPLLGAALPQTVPTLSGTISLDPPVVSPTGRSTARVVGKSSDGTTLWPSGLAVRSLLDEKLVLSGGGELYEAPFSADLVLYHFPLTAEEQGAALPGAAGAMSFKVSPSPKAAEVLLESGFENMRLFPFPEQLDRGSVLGPAGGSIVSPDGTELLLSEGALAQRTVVKATRLTAAELSALPAIAGFDIVAAVRVDLAGTTLARPATLKVPVPSGLAPDPNGDLRFALATMVDQPSDGRGAFARVIERAKRAETPEKIVASPEAVGSTLPLEGLLREGLYLFLHAKATIGYVSGLVLLENGTGVTGARTTAAGLGTADLSIPGGTYVLATPASAQLTALHPTRSESGNATVPAFTNNEAHTNITITIVGPKVVDKAPTGGSEPIGAVVTVRFDRALDAASVTSSTLRAELANADGTPSGASFMGSVRLSDPTTIALTPSFPLPPGRKIICTFVGGVRDTGGTPYAGGAVTWSFTTSGQLSSSGQVHPELFHLEIPIDGKAKIKADAGAVPFTPAGQTPWAVWAITDGPLDPVLHTVSPGSDGSVEYTLGNPPSYPVTISSKVWVKVASPDGSIAATFPLGPFVTPDRKGFVAPPGEETKFVSIENVEITVPAAAFDVATLVKVSNLDPATLGVTPNAGMAVAAYVNVDFDGTAKETLRVKVPLPPASTAAVGSLAFAGTPIDLPWGKKLQILDLGSVVDGGNGTKLISNYETDQPADPPTPGGAMRTGSRQALAGSPKTLTKTALLELTSRNAAAWVVGSGAELTAVTGTTVTYELMREFGVLWNAYADQMVYLPKPQNWTGHYILPAIAGQSFKVVAKDRSTGWTIFEQDFGTISGSTGSLVSVPSIKDDDPTPAVLSDAYPFSISRFKAVKAEEGGETCFSVRLELQACSLTGDLVKAKKVPEYPLVDETRLTLDNVTAQKSSEVVKVVLGDFEESKITIPGKSGEEMVLAVSPGDLDPDGTSEFRFAWDKPILPIPAEKVATAVKLTDCGEIKTANCGSGTAFPLKLDAGGDPTTVSFTMLRVLLQGELPHGHLFLLKLDSAQFRREYKTGGVMLTARGPSQFFFATKKSAQNAIGSSDPNGVFGQGVGARDLVKLGNLLIVSTNTGQLVAVDVSTSRPNPLDPLAPIPFKAYARLGVDTFDEIRALKSDGHNRLFFNGRAAGLWSLKAVRLEDIRNATPANCKQDPSKVPAWATNLPCFLPVDGGVSTAFSSNSALLATEYLTLVGTLPMGIPSDMDALVEDYTEPAQELRAFYDAHKFQNAPDFESLTWDAKGFTKFVVHLDTKDHKIDRGSLCAGEPGTDRYQRVTVQNLTTGQSWSFDVENTWPTGPGDGTLDAVDIRARRGDKLTVKYNLRTLGYVGLVGSGVSVFDLNRFYKLPAIPADRRGECGRRLGKYEGTDLAFTSCYGVPDLSTQPSIFNTTAVAVLGPSGSATTLDVFVPVSHYGGVRAASDATKPGDLAAGEAACFRNVRGDVAQGEAPPPSPWMRAIALGQHLTWLDKGITGDLSGHFTAPKAEKEWKTNKGRALVFFSLGEAGILAFDLNERKLEKPIGRFFKRDHYVYRVQVDETTNRLFAGGNTTQGEPFIDVWDIERVNGGPDPGGFDPRLLASIKAPWETTHIGFDEAGSGLVYTWGAMVPGQAPQGFVLPITDPEFVFAGLYAPTKEEPVPPGGTPKPPYPEERTTSAFVPLGVPMRLLPEDEAKPENRKKDERLATAAFRVRVALPGDFGETVVAKVQSLRGMPAKDRLNQDDIGGFIGMPGGPGWPESEVFVTLRRLGSVDALRDDPNAPAPPSTPNRFTGESGRLSLTYNLYESKEVVLLLADPRARDEYWKTKQVLGTDQAPEPADEKTQCRRCERPAYIQRLIDDGRITKDDVKELLAGGPWVRAVLSVTKSDPGKPEPPPPLPPTVPVDDGRTQKAIVFFGSQKDYGAPRGTARITTSADEVLSPIQSSLKEPVLNAAAWDSGERGVAILLGGGEATFSAVDYFKPGRGIDIAFDRNYRSGILGYGPLGSSGWSSSHLAHVRRIPLYGEAAWDTSSEAPPLSALEKIPELAEYHDGTGKALRFLTPGGSIPCDPAISGFITDQEKTSYCVQQGVYLRLQRLANGSFRLLSKTNDALVFDEEGRLAEVRDRHRELVVDPKAQGNTHTLAYDAFGALAQLEDEYGRVYRLEYHDKPKEGGERYGLLKRITDFAERKVDYEWRPKGESGPSATRGDRTLLYVFLPEVTHPTLSDPAYVHTGGNRPAITYDYRKDLPDLEKEAPHHGPDFSKLRLIGIRIPGSDDAKPPRVSLEYETATGRVTKLTVPTGITWQVKKTGGSTSAAPASEVSVVTPWSHVATYVIEKGRTQSLTENLPAIAASADVTSVDAAPTDLRVITAYEYEDDGRLRSVDVPYGQPDHIVTKLEYPKDEDTKADRFKAANVWKQTLTGLDGTPSADPTKEPTPVERLTEYTHDEQNLLKTIATSLAKALLPIDKHDPQTSVPSTLTNLTLGKDELSSTSTFDVHARLTKSAGTDPNVVDPVVETKEFFDDASGRQGKGYPKTIDHGGLLETFDYDNAANPKLHSMGDVLTTTTFDEWDRPVKVEPAGSYGGKYKDTGAKVERGFDAAGHLTLERVKQTSVDGAVIDSETRWEYNEREQVSKVTKTKLADENGGANGANADAVTSFGFDQYGRLLTTTSPAGVVTTLTYDEPGRVTAETSGSGTTKTLFDPMGRVAFTTDGDQGFWRGKTNAFGELYEERLPTGAKVTRFFDAHGNLKHEIVKDGDTLLADTEFDRNSFGEASKTTEHLTADQGTTKGETRVTEKTFDLNGRLLTVSSGDGASKKRTDLKLTYDAKNRVSKQEDAVGNKEEPQYDGASSLWPDHTVLTEAGGVTFTRNFLLRDANGRVRFESRSDGTSTLATYDEVGNLVSTSSGQGAEYDYVFDGAGKLVEARSPLNGKLTIGYDLDGRVKNRDVASQSGRWRTSFDYDLVHAGRLTKVTYPDGTFEEYKAFAPDDVVTSFTNRYGQIITNEVDAANRIKSMTPNGGPTGLSSYGMAWTYDALSRVKSVEKAGIASSRISRLYDLGGRPTTTQLGAGTLSPTFDVWDRVPSNMVRSDLAGGTRDYRRELDDLDRPTKSSVMDGAGATVVPGATMSWSGLSNLGLTTTLGQLPFKQRLEHEVPGRVSKVVFSGTQEWGALQPRYRTGDAYKDQRSAPTTGLFANQGWSFTPDPRLRLTDAKAGQLESFHLGYGIGDELTESDQLGKVQLVRATADFEGRIKTYGDASFQHDAAGNRSEDDRYVYSWTWRGELASVTVKDSWPKYSGEPPFAGEKVTYEYDALGRLVSRVHKGKIPSGGTDDARPLKETREFLWGDDGNLLVEAGKNDIGQTVWRKTLVPGAGLDGAVQMRVERFQSVGRPDALYSFVRDEQGTVLGLVDEQGPAPTRGPPVPARYFYAPLGEAHVESGPELLSARFDSNLKNINGTQQDPAIDKQTLPGGITFVTSASFDPDTLAGVKVERFDVAENGWTDAPRGDFVIAQENTDPTRLSLFRRACWPKGERYRIRLTRELKDDMARPFSPPSGSEFEAVLVIPAGGVTPPSYEKKIDFVYDSVKAASDTVGDRIPGGMTLLHDGAWTDPVTGLELLRARWRSPRDGTFLSEDPLGDVDSPSKYAYVAWQPNRFTDPMGTCAGLDNVPCGEYAFSIADQFLNPANDWGNFKRSAVFTKDMFVGAALAVPRFIKSIPQTVSTAMTLANTAQEIATDPVLAYNIASSLVANRAAVGQAAMGLYRQVGNAALNADPQAAGEFLGEQLFWAGAAGFGATAEGGALIGRVRSAFSFAELSDAAGAGLADYGAEVSRLSRVTNAGASVAPTALGAAPAPLEWGYIYLRKNPVTGRVYVGQAESYARFVARQTEHDLALGTRHVYTVLTKALPGADLDVAEETFIRIFGGPSRKGGLLANYRYQMSETRYQRFGVGVPGKPLRPTH